MDSDLARAADVWGLDASDRLGNRAKSISECQPAGSKVDVGRLVKQMLRQRCDMGLQSLSFVA
jgi:hypothetical protein